MIKVVAAAFTGTAQPKQSALHLPSLRAGLKARREADRISAAHYAPPGVLINAEGQILQFRGATDAFLQPPLGEATFNLFKMAREGLCPPLRKAVAKARRHPVTVSCDGLRMQRQGVEFLVSLQVIPLPSSNPPCFLILFEDEGQPTSPSQGYSQSNESQRIAELERRTVEISMERDYAQATLRTAPMPFLVLRADLRVDMASEAFYAAFKVTPSRTEGRLIYEIGNGQWNIPRLRELLEEIIPQKNVFNGFEVVHEFALIGIRTMLLNARRVDNAEGAPERILLAIEDITERKKTEKAISVAMVEIEKASRAKDDFLAALSHELRTPLTPVLMTAIALEGDLTLPASVREQLAMMCLNIELEARLIDDLLDLTRITRGKLQITPVAVDLNNLLHHTREILRSDSLAKKVRIVFELAATRHYIMADPTRMQQVLWNLLKNAIKFTPTGGTVTVTTRTHDDSSISIRVEDTGVGISAESLPQIFNAFEQGDATGLHRYGGLGLGLAISRAIVIIHGGTICASSSGQGQGATFIVTLATVDAPDALTNPVSQVIAHRSLRLLIVEDHEATREVLERLLTRYGHRVTTAGSMEAALKAYAADSFDAVVSDVGLPDGSGLELMRELRRQGPVAGIALSGYGMEDDLRKTKEAGFFAHLVKPVKLDQLRLLLDQLPARL